MLFAYFYSCKDTNNLFLHHFFYNFFCMSFFLFQNLFFTLYINKSAAVFEDKNFPSLNFDCMFKFFTFATNNDHEKSRNECGS